MPQADRVLYAAFLRLTRRFKYESLPLVGIAGSGRTCYPLDFRADLRAAFHRPPTQLGFSVGARLLSKLEAQLSTLCEAEEQTREALAEWASLVETFLQQGIQQPFAAAAAAEQGIQLLSRQAKGLTEPLRLDPEEPEKAEEAEGGPAQRRRPLSIEQLVADVRQGAPHLFPASPDSPCSSSSTGSNGDDVSSSASHAAATHAPPIQEQQLQRERLAALADVLYRQHKLRYEPFEWVYDGLQPLLLPEVLKRRKGMPLTLAALAAAAGRRLGVPLVPLPGESAEQAAASTQLSASLAGQQDLLSPELATHVASRTPATAPPPSSWVLLLSQSAGHDGGPGSSRSSGTSSSIGSSSNSSSSSSSSKAAISGSGGAAIYLDAANGTLLDEAGVQAKYPTAQLGLNWHERAALTFWQESVRTVMQAHQRRGESDLVAHWIYVLLALDPQAAEWSFMLHPESRL